LPEVLAAVKLRVGNEIAHLPYARLDVTPEAKGWNIVAIWSAMHGVIRTFVDSAPYGRRAIVAVNWIRARSLHRPAADGA
jgi:hypothetical protein